MGLEITFDISHGSERLIDIIQLIADLSNSKIHLLLAEVGIELDDLIEVVKTGFQLTFSLLDEP